MGELLIQLVLLQQGFAQDPKYLLQFTHGNGYQKELLKCF
jgi:hypothetical protein